MEVKVTKCQNGHYFDSNKHTNCPHCGAAEFTVNIPQPKKSGFGLFKKKDKSVEITAGHKMTESFSPKLDSAIKIEDVIPTDSQQAFVIEDVVTEGAFSAEESLSEIEDVETEGFFSSGDNRGDIEDVVTTGMFSVDETPNVDDKLTAGFFSEEPVESKQPLSNGGSLLEEIKSVTADNDVRTVGVFSLNNTVEDKNEIQEPVVGWLVCVGGKHIGKDFKIIAGKNSIGRNGGNDITLESEESVSREKHAWIIYEPRKREFFAKPGESSGLTYLNDENIFDAKKLSHGDILEFGDTKFIFIPLCGESFSWSDYISKE